jgi:hypothetical protein
MLLGGCHAQSVSQGQITDRSGVRIRFRDLQITNTMIELRCEIVNCTGKDIWVCESVRDIPDANGIRTATAGISANEDDRTLIIDAGIRGLYGSGIWCNVGGTYTRLTAGQSSPAVLRTFLTIPWYSTAAPGFRRMLKQGVDHLSGISFEIGYFTETDLASLITGPNSIHQIVEDDSADRIDVFDSSQGELCRKERVARIVVDGISLHYTDWLGEEQGEERGQALE